MKTIEFGFTPENLAAAAGYLAEVDAKPVAGKIEKRDRGLGKGCGDSKV